MNIDPDTAKTTLCKNILIYGYCKFENKGCAFNHNIKRQNKTSTPAQGNNSGGSTSSESQNMSNGGSSGGTMSEKRKFNLNTPSFMPSTTNGGNKFGSSPKIEDIPVFVPSGMGSDSKKSHPNSVSLDDVTSSIKKFNVSTPSFTPSNPYSSEATSGSTVHTSNVAPIADGNVGHPSIYGNDNMAQSNMQQLPPRGNDMYFSNAASSYPLQYHLYAPAPPPRLAIPLPANETNVSDMFIPNDLRETLQRKNEATLFTIPGSTLPEHVNVYHSITPIDNQYEPKSAVFNIPTAVFKSFSNENGLPYALRKFEISEIMRITNEAPFKFIKRWKTIKCANIVQIQEAFTTMAFGGSYSSLIAVYDYFPRSVTLEEHHIKRTLGSKLEPITEILLWNYAIQIYNALSAIHEKDLAARSSLDLSKIIVTNKNRIRLSAVGVNDILEFEKDEAEASIVGLQEYRKKLQVLDIRNFFKVMIQLATLCLPLSLHEGSPQELISNLRGSSKLQLSGAFLDMLSALSTTEDLHSFMKEHLASKMCSFANDLQDSCDYMESQLSTELENARLFRLITKINFIIDRPEFVNDPAWSENGSLYLIKLFRDYIFFEYDNTGKPVCNLSRVLANLNKLDAGIDEKFLLVTRDEKSCIIASYKEIRDIIDTIFKTLTRGK